MSDFLDNLKKRYGVKVDPSRSDAELQEDFRAEVKKFLKQYLAALDKSLDKINIRALSFFDKIKHQSVGSQDHFSKNFEKEVSYAILEWIATDETLRTTFKKIKLAFAKKLMSTTMQEILDEQILEFEKNLAAHVAKANAYGKNWGERMDEVGIVPLLSETRMTIKWFQNLTVEELRKSLERL